MPTFDEILQQFPDDVQDSVRAVWDSLTPAEKDSLLDLAGGIPSEANLVKLLIQLSSTQLKQVFGQKSRVAIVGPANVGKSTLYNQFTHSKEESARVSPLPGTTRMNQEGDAGLFTVIDTPGADAIGEVGEREKEEALRAARDADFLIILFDSIQGIKKTEKEIFNELISQGKPYVVALNKIDLVKGDQDGVLRMVTNNLDLRPGQVIPLTAKSGKNMDRLLISIAAVEPSIVAALGSAMPAYRYQLAWRNIISAASISGAIALLPLPVVDFGPLVVNQSVMVLGIARIYNYKINLERARELIAAFGVGLLGRMLFQELSKLGGIPGWVLSAAIAASTTVVMGYASIEWFDKGEAVSTERLNQLTRSLTEQLLGALKNLGRKKPSAEQVQDAISEALGEITIEEKKYRDEIE